MCFTVCNISFLKPRCIASIIVKTALIQYCTASVGSGRDILKYKWNCTCAKEFSGAVEDVDVDKQVTYAQKATGL